MSEPGCIEAVVFDLDGTLADTMALAPQAYADTIRCLGGPEVSPGEVVAAWHVGPTPVVLEHFLGRAVTSRDVDRFYGSFEALVLRVQPFPGILRMLRSLRRHGYRLGIFTHATRRAATMTLAAAGLDRFQLTLVSGEEIAEPPNPPPRVCGLPASASTLPPALLLTSVMQTSTSNAQPPPGHLASMPAGERQLR